jgi:RNA polymerase sigma-70 factor (ECF subfamily)
VDDDELLRRWAGGDRDAGNDLVRRHFSAVYRFFQRRTPAAEAEDLTQRTFEVVLHKQVTWQGRGSFRSYLFGIARNQLLMHLRKEGRKAGREVAVEGTHPGPTFSPSGQVAAKQEQKVLLRAMRTLPIDLQIALELFYWEGLSNAEVAEVLDVRPTTITTRLWRARDSIRDALAHMDIADSVAESTVVDLDKWARSLRDLVDER